MSNAKDVCFTHSSLLSDLQGKICSSPSIRPDGKLTIVKWLESLRTTDAGDILYRYPVLYRQVNYFLANGDCDAGVVDSLYPSFLSLESEVLVITVVRQALGLYARLTFSRTEMFKSGPPRLSGAAEGFVPPSPHDSLTSFEGRMLSELPCQEISVLPFISERILAGFDLKALVDGKADVPFRHGPGVVAERCIRKGVAMSIDDEDMDWVHWTFFRPLFEDDSCLGRYDSRHLYPARKGSKSSRVMLVPKDYRGPRIIAAEPVLHQYVQQGIARLFVQYLSRSVLRKAIHFDDQSYNQRAAMQGSRDLSVATVDLKDASDMVRVHHIEQAFKRRPDLKDTFLSARTRIARVGARSFEHSCFATMGSAMCFPMESYIFALTAISATWPPGRTISYQSIFQWIDEIKLLVYGDDIIVSMQYLDQVLKGLQNSGFVVNDAKTCHKTPFRESCGVDAFNGYDITALRPRSLPGSDVSQWSATLSNARNLLARGLIRAALTVLLAGMTKRNDDPVKARYVTFCLSNEEEVADCPWVICADFDLLYLFWESFRYTRTPFITVQKSKPVVQDLVADLWQALSPHNPTQVREKHALLPEVKSRKLKFVDPHTFLRLGVDELTRICDILSHQPE